ncbi:MAG: YncE family protein [bacterium]
MKAYTTIIKSFAFFWFSLVVFSLLFLSTLSIPERALAATEKSYTLFESGQVRPLALSPDGKTLFAVNTPDNRLEIFNVTKKGLYHRESVFVGLEPVAVAVRSNEELWVVNHISDSVSIVKTSKPGFMRVVRTLLVGDEPSDIVFAGEKNSRAFITCAHRGQNAPFDPQLTTAGIGRADVWVFDVNNLGNGLGGRPLTIINLFTDTPRSLSVSPDGKRIYAAGFKTGNRTTTIAEEIVTANGGLPEPTTNYEGIEQPATGLIVKYNGEHWIDELGREWDEFVKFSLPDKDVFVIDARADPPKLIPGPEGFFTGVGTVLFNMTVNPSNGNVYVANTDALNKVRFEGPGIFAGHSVRGHLAENRITILRNGEVLPRHLNKHIDYENCCDTIPNDENRKSLAFPMGMAVSCNGKTLYVTAFGSSKVGIFDTAKLENDTFEPDETNQIKVTGGGPSGLVLDEDRNCLYVLTRFDNSISIIDIKTRKEKAHIAMYTPEPESVVRGRSFLYDASHTSSHGDSACASCHVFGDFDGLAWDLGNPDGDEINNPGPFAIVPSEVNYPEPYNMNFSPMKGPMTTQSLRGLANHGPMHWRGDRTGGNDAPSEQPDSGTFDEEAAFKKFNIAFLNLNGRHAELTEEEMQAFTDFILQITYPPNPIRNLDNSLTPVQQAGHDIFFNGPIVDTKFRCGECHVVDPDANAEFGVEKPGFFGTKGLNLFIFLPQTFKIPNLRNVYQQVGKFGMPETNTFPFYFDESNTTFMGDQIRGFGILHDGSIDTVFRFLHLVAFSPREPDTFWPGDPGNHPGLSIEYPEGLEMRRQLEQFIFAFPTNLAPIVGQQVTLNPTNEKEVTSRIDLMIKRAEAGECDLVAKRKQWYGYLYAGSGAFKDNMKGHFIKDKTLRKIARAQYGEVTYTCVPPGDGIRIGLDRDEDGCFDRCELLCGSDPADPMSTCDMKKD